MTNMAKQPYSSFDALASVIEQLGADGRSVDRVEAAADGEDGELRATVEVDVPLEEGDDGVRIEPSDTAADGLRFELSLPGLRRNPEIGDTDADVTVRSREATVAGAAVRTTLEVVIVAPEGSRSDEARSPADSGALSTTPASTPQESTPAASPDSEPAVERTASVDDDARPEENEAAATTDESQRSPLSGREESGTEPDRVLGAPDASDVGGEAPTAVRDESVPPYEDTPYLRRLYEVCDTFDEMSERIEMDVSAETVRRYMIDADVHSPRSYTLGDAEVSTTDDDETQSEAATRSEAATQNGAATHAVEHAADSGSTTDDGRTPDVADATGQRDASDATPEAAPSKASEGEQRADETAPPAPDGSSERRGDGDGSQATAEDAEELLAPDSLPDEQLIADGIGLPETLTLPDVVDAVIDARTVHEVGRELGLEHDRTRRLLRQLNVLDLVLCRVSNASGGRCSVETVAGRIRQCTIESA
ncbi:hypothetical protein SAMN04487946_104104 [Halobellus clavatus]|uniref:Uncharacterized protein n=2 Tax=Halobellus clavatus TaxID=660517 RepID=A0A1H3FPV5_9EURY|nr:hypothetical protein SAMN04487946_104104 [Halobellus clavatus]